MVRDDIYNPTNTVLPQQRTLRLRAQRRSTPAVSSKGKEKEVVVHEDEMWGYDMSYVSGLINASEYRDMEVRSYVGVGVVDPKSAAPKKERKKQSEGDRAGIKVSQVTGMHNARLINSPLDPSLISP